MHSMLARYRQCRLLTDVRRALLHEFRLHMYMLKALFLVKIPLSEISQYTGSNITILNHGVIGCKIKRTCLRKTELASDSIINPDQHEYAHSLTNVLKNFMKGLKNLLRQLVV